MPAKHSQPLPDRSATPAVARETGSVGTGGGAKHDAGKIRAGLVLADFPRALLAVGEVATFGCPREMRGDVLRAWDAAAQPIRDMKAAFSSPNTQSSATPKHGH